MNIIFVFVYNLIGGSYFFIIDGALCCGNYGKIFRHFLTMFRKLLWCILHAKFLISFVRVESSFKTFVQSKTRKKNY